MRWEPERVQMQARRIAGVNRRYRMGQTEGIPAQWADYDAVDQSGDSVVPEAWYGVCHDFQGEEFGYLCGMELAPGAVPAAGLTQVDLPPGAWARFVVPEGLDQMPAVWAEIHSHWLRQPEWQSRPGPSVEFYPPTFDGATGQGGFEIWVPVT